MSTDEILLPPEVADRLRVTESTLATWRSSGYPGPKWFRIGRKKIGYLSSDVDAFIRRSAQLASDEQDRRSA